MITVPISTVNVAKTVTFADAFNNGDSVSAEAKAGVLAIRADAIDLKFTAAGNFAYPENVNARVDWTVVEFY